MFVGVLKIIKNNTNICVSLTNIRPLSNVCLKLLKDVSAKNRRPSSVLKSLQQLHYACARVPNRTQMTWPKRVIAARNFNVTLAICKC